MSKNNIHTWFSLEKDRKLKTEKLSCSWGVQTEFISFQPSWSWLQAELYEAKHLVSGELCSKSTWCLRLKLRADDGGAPSAAFTSWIFLALWFKSITHFGGHETVFLWRRFIIFLWFYWSPVRTCCTFTQHIVFWLPLNVHILNVRTHQMWIISVCFGEQVKAEELWISYSPADVCIP